MGGIQLSPDDDGAFGKHVHQFLKNAGFVADYMKSEGDNGIVTTAHNPTCNVLYRRDVFETAGGFLTTLWPGEDVELDYRISNRGYVHCFNPKAAVSHYRPDTFDKFSRMMFRYGMAQAFLVKKYGYFRPVQCIPALLVVAGVVTALFPKLILLSLLFAGCGFFYLLLKCPDTRSTLHCARLSMAALLYWNAGFFSHLWQERGKLPPADAAPLPARKKSAAAPARTMRVLIVNRYMSMYGGAENVVKELSEHLCRAGVKNKVLTLNISDEVRRKCKGLDIETPDKHFPYAFRSVGFFSALGILDEIYHLRKLVAQHAKDFDVINVHNFPANWVTGGTGKPVVWMCNEPPDFWNNPHPSLPIRLLRKAGIVLDQKLVNSLVDHICVADELNAQRAKNRYGRTSTIVPYGIDTEVFNDAAFDRNKFRASYGLGLDDFILLQVGIVCPQKNQIASLKALSALLQENKKAKLVLVGRNDTPYKAMMEKLISSGSLTDKVLFTGMVSKETAAKFYLSADLCLFPVKEQGGWLAPFEALVCKKPVIVSQTVGASRLIQEHNFGIVSDDFSRDILTMARNYKEYSSHALRASQWIQQHLTWKQFTDKMIELFRQSLEEKPT